MKLLVTGGAGFIGGNFVNYWMENHPDDEVTVLDCLTYAGNLDRLSKVQDNKKFKFVKGDILDYNLTCKHLKGVDIVVHFAAESHVDRSLSGLDAEFLFNRTNLDGTITLLHAVKDNGVQRFHHVSTDEVFGDLEYNTDEKFHEDYPYNPHNPYAISKAAADFAVRGFARSHGLKYTISNCTNNYGPYQTPEKVIPRAISLLLNNQRISLYTDANGIPGPNVRDWLYMDDHCSAIESILLRGKIGETYCIGGNCELSNKNLVERILKGMSEITGKTMTFDKNVTFVQDRPGHDKRYAMDTTKIETKLNWKPKYSFETGFKATVEWYTSDEGRKWLNSLSKTSEEVREGQDNKKI